MPMNLTFTSNKVICCVRNPLDCLVSYACFINTLNHSTKPEFDFEKDFPQWWDWFIRHQTMQMKRWFTTLIQHCVKEERNPIHFVRYEDMCSD